MKSYKFNFQNGSTKTGKGKNEIEAFRSLKTEAKNLVGVKEIEERKPALLLSMK